MARKTSDFYNYKELLTVLFYRSSQNLSECMCNKCKKG